MRRPSPVQPGEEVAGKYRVDQVLGAGAMGVVVRALHIDLRQDVAIKFLHPELAVRADSAERFRREAYSAARIPSDHVPHVFDAGALEGSNIPYIVMEYLQGRDLARELAARGPLRVAEAARHVLEACDAVGEAHARGIVHRDLKPANLFLAETAGGARMIKVLDFGISKTLGPGPAGLSITEPAMLMGSPGYMSPEQLESSRNVDARTDIWSLGVILFELVTGSLPFDGESVPQLIRSVIGGKRARLDELGPELAALEPVVARCLQQDRARRFQNVGELCEALTPLVPEPLERAFDLVSPSAPGSQRGAPSENASTTGAQRDLEVVPDSGWGWTHAMRRSSLGRTLVIAALLGALGAVVIGQGRRLLRPAPADDGRIEVVETGSLEPLPAPDAPPSQLEAGKSTSASDGPTVVAGGEATTPSAPSPTPREARAGSESAPSPPRADAPPANPPAANPPPANPVRPTAPPASASPATAPRATPKPLPAAPNAVAPSAPAPAAASGVARGEADAPNARGNQGSASAPPPAAAGAPARPAAPSEAPAGHAPAGRNQYEIEEFGGRE